MARRKRQSPIEDLMEIAVLLPWWISVIIALVSYLFLTLYISQPIPTTSGGLENARQAVGNQFFRILAYFGRYLLAFIFLLGAAVSFIKGLKRQALVKNAVNQPGTAIRNMSWQEFELLIGELFRMRGYSVEETGGHGPDGGIDLKLRKGGETFLVQCKQWKAYKVSVNIVRELYGVMTAEGVAGGFVVTSGKFTSEAVSFARDLNIQLIDGIQLSAVLKSSNTHALFNQPVEQPATSLQEAIPTCPNCNSSMIKRTATKGRNAGGHFWGCSRFPACRGIRPIH